MPKNNQYERVRYLLETVPATRESDQLLTVMYWRIFDGIEIPKDVAKDIVEKGAVPESLTRYRRDVQRNEKELGILEDDENGNDQT
jgi:hypothetical protein